VALSLLAAFFVAPYARPYDFPVLLIPLLVLVGDRLPELPAAALLMAVVLLPYVQFLLLLKYRRLYTTTDFILESTYFWIPLVLAAVWFATRRRGRVKDQTP
jgi:hypothetical protein